MKSFHTLLIISVVLLTSLFVSQVVGIIPKENVSATVTPTNNTYFNVAFPNFNITFVGENLTYNLELIINSSGRGIRNINDSIIANLTTNTSLGDGQNYTWYFNVSNGTQSNISNVTLVFTIDTTRPLITYEATQTNSLINNSNWSQSTFNVNVSYTEINFDNVTFNLLNSSTANINGTKFNGSNSRAINFSGLADGTYRLNVTVVDRANNTNSSEQRTFTIDSTRPLITYEGNGFNGIANNTYWSNSTLYINVSYTETNFANVTFNFLNSSTANINGTKYNASAERAINITNLADGVYRLNITVVDTANNTNSSEQRTFTIDTTKPVIIYEGTGMNSLENNTNWSQSTFGVNVSYTEINFDNVTFNLLNSSTANINGTFYFGSSNRSINFSGLADGTYRLNVTVKDLANNTNYTEQRTFTIDTTRPLITYEGTGLNGIANNTYWGSDSTFRVNVSYTETNFANVTINLLNSSTANINGTKYNASTERALNFTSLADGVYRLNITVVDTGNNTNSSEQRTFTIDTTKPLITLEANGNHSIVNNTNYSLTVLRINVSYTETNFGNVTFHLNNVTNGSSINMNSTFFSAGSGNRSINFSALSDGLYVYNVTAVDLANNSNYSQQMTFRVDTTRPLVNHTGGTVGNNSNLTVSYFAMNVTVTETNFANMSFIVANASNGSQIFNTTLFNDTSRLYLNYTVNGDGNYTVNVTVTDTANNRNMTVNQFVTVDITLPTVSFTVSPTSITPVEAVTIGTCTATDRMDPNVQGTLTIKKAGGSSFSSVSAGAYTDTSAEGTYTVRCTSQDFAGNTVTLDKTFTVGAGGSTGGSSGGGGSSSSNPPADKAPGEQTLPALAPEVEESVDIEESEAWDIEGSVQYAAVAPGEVYAFSFVSLTSGEQEKHSVSISSVDEEAGTVTLVVESDPQEITLAIGESQEVDLDSDGVSDLLVTLNGITEGLADLTFAKLGDWIEVEELAVVEEEGRSYVWLVWTLVALVLIFLFVLVLMKGTKKPKVVAKASGPYTGRRR